VLYTEAMDDDSSLFGVNDGADALFVVGWWIVLVLENCLSHTGRRFV